MKSSAFANFAPEIVSQLRNYGKLMRIDKPIGTWLLLWPTLWALWLAGEGAPDGVVYPSVQDGFRGVAFVDACVRSSKRNGAWVSPVV